MGIVEIVIVVVVMAGIVIAIFRWDRYRGNTKHDSAGLDAHPTAEVFVDPETGRRMRVWFDSTTGKREYRSE